MTEARTVLGEPLAICSQSPETDFYRDGCYRARSDDLGTHAVCAQMSREFLEFSRACGNDLSTSRLEFGFPGLKPGERWCLCAR